MTPNAAFINSQQPPSKPKPAAPSSNAPLTPTSDRVSCKTASRISAPVSTPSGVSELQIASRISRLALFDEPGLVLPL